jgi:hypothetical protein
MLLKPSTKRRTNLKTYAKSPSQLAGSSSQNPAPRNDSPGPEPEGEEDYICTNRYSFSDEEEMLSTSSLGIGPGKIRVVYDPPGAVVE